MNEQYYAQLYAKYHGANAYRSTPEKFVRIPLYTVSRMKLAYLKMKSLRKKIWHDCDRPLVRAIVAHSNVKTIATVCHDPQTTWCVLLGNQKIVFPQNDGDLTLTATPYFAKRENLDGFRSFVVSSLGAVSLHDDVYRYDGAILFLDPYDVGYPGGNYFSHDGGEGEWFRLCLITKSSDPYPDILHNLIQEKFLLVTNHFKLKSVETSVSPFLNLWTPQRVRYSSDWIVNTSVVNANKRHFRPSFVIQDVLDTYGRGKSVGLLIEAPIRVSYDYENVVANDERKFHALAVNCTTPQRILYVPRPYDRYYEIDRTHDRQDLRWTNVFYDDAGGGDVTMSAVVWDGNVLGYSYKDTFFCLSDVKLTTNFMIEFRNVFRLFDKLTFDVVNDQDFFVLNSSSIDGGFRLHTVKHRSLPYELHCVEEVGEEASKRYKKDLRLTPLVKSWLDLITTAPLPDRPFVDVELVKLAHVLVRHRVCFSLREKTSDDLSETFENDDTIVFHVDADVKNFINQMRFDADRKEGGKSKEEEESCVIF